MILVTSSMVSAIRTSCSLSSALPASIRATSSLVVDDVEEVRAAPPDVTDVFAVARVAKRVERLLPQELGEADDGV